MASAPSLDRGSSKSSALTLYLVIDAVPHAMALEAWQDGLLPGACRPRRMIAPFPSTTTVSLTGIMRGVDSSVRTPGYEERYYDATNHEIRGGVLGGLREEGTRFPYTGYFAGYEQSVFDEARIYAFPERAALHDVRTIERHLVDASQEQWCGYIGGTDGAAHLGGMDKQETLVRAIFRNLDRLRQAYLRERGRRLELVVMSDHGFCFDFEVRLPVETVGSALEDLGLSVVDALERPGQAVLSPWGMVGAGAVYCFTRDRRHIAERLVELPLVQLTVADLPGQGIGVWRLRDDHREEALVHADPDLLRFRYEPLTGDPLDLLDTWNALDEKGHVDEAGFVDEARLLDATWAAPFPDALYRLCDSFYRLVRSPPGVAFSLHDDTACGSEAAWRAASVLGGLEGTHGNLGRVQSHGFFLTTLEVPGLHRHAVRYDQAMALTTTGPGAGRRQR